MNDPTKGMYRQSLTVSPMTHNEDVEFLYLETDTANVAIYRNHVEINGETVTDKARAFDELVDLIREKWNFR